MAAEQDSKESETVSCGCLREGHGKGKGTRVGMCLVRKGGKVEQRACGKVAGVTEVAAARSQRDLLVAARILAFTPVKWKAIGGLRIRQQRA